MPIPFVLLGLSLAVLFTVWILTELDERRAKRGEECDETESVRPHKHDLPEGGGSFFCLEPDCKIIPWGK